MISSVEKKIKYAQLPERICAWYAEHRRQLPWREERDPYRIWVSEIMLQQTRVEAVRPYYARFLSELPDAAALASCPEEKLLKLWEGLGYYSRVRNMQKAARLLENGIPSDPKELQKLPGIGSYTAGAIASIAYGVRVPAVDGNVLRILSRVTADDTDILKASVKREAEQVLTKVLQQGSSGGSGAPGMGAPCDPGDFNQGMMDLGAGVCLPNAVPLCDKCPLADICEAHRTGRETDFPVRKKAKERRIEQRTILVVRDGERVALTRRQEKGLLGGMYEFPNLSGDLGKRAVLRIVEEQKLEPLHIKKLEPARHLFSHVEWRMSGYEIRVAVFPEEMCGRIDPHETERPGTWFLAEIGQIENTYPVPSAYRAYADYLQMKLGVRDNNKKTIGSAAGLTEGE